ncbi:MAG TPA: glucosaminidase domain-containing protein [Candidatus Udaeobacter sp.]|nr:glucosaminidase domain-containing protein [Candidatus Udaeobacter sp.]
MRKKLNQHLFIYLLILSLIITLGMYVKPLNNAEVADLSEAPQKLTAAAASSITTAAPGIDPIVSSVHLAVPSSTSIATSAGTPDIPIEQPPSTLPKKQIQAEKEQAIVEKPDTYKVTAYYLNVRTKPSAQSEIIKVVKQGTRLKVTAKTENGWLELQGGGYVHGGYAAKIKGEVSALSFSAASKRDPAIEINDAGAEKEQQSEKIAKPEVEELNKPTSIVESDSGLTEAHIAKIFEGTALSGHNLEQAILEIEEEYGINAYFTIAVMKLESGNGKSYLAKKKNNLFGLNAIDGNKYNKAFSFKTKGDSVRKFGQLLSRNYVNKGLTTIEKVARKYCPANSRWSSLVKNIMKRDYKKL